MVAAGPLVIITIRSDSSTASSTSWVTINTVLPVSATMLAWSMAAVNSITACGACVSSARVDSNSFCEGVCDAITITSGSIATARLTRR